MLGRLLEIAAGDSSTRFHFTGPCRQRACDTIPGTSLPEGYCTVAGVHVKQQGATESQYGPAMCALPSQTSRSQLAACKLYVCEEPTHLVTSGAYCTPACRITCPPQRTAYHENGYVGMCEAVHPRGLTCCTHPLYQVHTEVHLSTTCTCGRPDRSDGTNNASCTD